MPCIGFVKNVAAYRCQIVLGATRITERLTRGKPCIGQCINVRICMSRLMYQCSDLHVPTYPCSELHVSMFGFACISVGRCRGGAGRCREVPGGQSTGRCFYYKSPGFQCIYDFAGSCWEVPERCREAMYPCSDLHVSMFRFVCIGNILKGHAETYPEACRNIPRDTK